MEEKVHQAENAISDVRDMIGRVLQALAAQKEAAESEAAANCRTKEMSEGAVGGNFEKIFVDADASEVAEASEINGADGNGGNANNF